jgi:mRNA-degrading endonuclease RelE of RelBE toxin-antitoxin system
MNCKIIAIDDFNRDAKRLAKKYASLKGELQELQALLLANPRTGTLIRENTYKIRLAVKSKGRGKSGGLRIITHVVEVEIEVSESDEAQDITIILVAIYDKSEMQNIDDAYLKNVLDDIEAELNDEN